MQCVQEKHIDLVRFLIESKEVDPAANNNAALRFSISINHQQLIELLRSDQRVLTAEKDVNKPTLARVWNNFSAYDK